MFYVGQVRSPTRPLARAQCLRRLSRDWHLCALGIKYDETGDPLCLGRWARRLALLRALSPLLRRLEVCAVGFFLAAQL